MITRSRKFFYLLCFVLAGFLVSGVLYFLFVVAVLNPLTSHTGEEPEAFLGLAFLIFLPVGVLCGSAVTGFLCQPYIRRPGVAAMVLAPGLYMALIFIIPTVLYGTVESFFSFMMAAALGWWGISYLGVMAGGYFRRRWGMRKRNVELTAKTTETTIEATKEKP
ncbi:MAG TPA: hypothetical protein PLI09_13590 [Candidatus Hydrogenedentes bacterium]|nr:hypothetical protein [Candidatus Hydrogenedentota bacterium]